MCGSNAWRFGDLEDPTFITPRHAMAVVAFLRAARACAQVAVVTLATEDNSRGYGMLTDIHDP